MTESRHPERAPKRSEESRRTRVRDGEVSRPFMRGIMIHALMARGVAYEDAYRAANGVRDRIRGRAEVEVDELAELVREVLGDRAPSHPLRVDMPESIEVTGSGQSLPFSKGLLSQSLLAAALDPNDAFDVAQQIEVELRQRGLKSIDRTDLRRLVCETLKHRMGSSVAERYLVWRHFQEPEKPVLLLLGGPPGAGKTTLGLEVAHRLGIPRVLSADSIRQIMRIMLSRDLVPAVHASSWEAHKLSPGGALGEDPVIEGYMAQASAVSVGVRAMLDRAVSENTSLVLDGVSLLPGLIDLDSYAEAAHVIFLVVALLDTDAYERRFAKRGEGERMRPKHRYMANLPAILQIQDQFLEKADQYDVPIVDNRRFDDSVHSILRTVTETLRTRESIHAEEWL